ncbi:hypothetical protein FORC48_3773 [Bacillus cereus]|nr:hypothetical protein FORC48_3773 [Bacillus cereus]
MFLFFSIIKVQFLLLVIGKEKEAIYFIASHSHHLYSFINDLFALITS